MLTNPTEKNHNSTDSLENALERGDDGPSVRIQLTLKPEFARKIAGLKKKAHADSYSEVVRDALRLYDHIVKLVGSEDQLLVRKSDGTLIQILF